MDESLEQIINQGGISLGVVGFGTIGRVITQAILDARNHVDFREEFSQIKDVYVHDPYLNPTNRELLGKLPVPAYIGSLDDLLDNSDTVLICSGWGNADYFFEKAPPEEIKKNIAQMPLQYEIYKALLEIAGIERFSDLELKDENGDPVRNEDGDLLLDIGQLKKCPIDYRVIRFLPGSAVGMSELARAFKRYNDEHNGSLNKKKIIIVSNPTGPNHYIFSEITGMVDNSTSFNHIDTYRGQTEIIPRMIRQGKYFREGDAEAFTTVGMHSTPLIWLLDHGDVEVDVKEEAMTRTARKAMESVQEAMEDIIDSLSDSIRFYAPDERGISREIIKGDAAYAFRQVMKAVINGRDYAVMGTLVEWQKNPNFKGGDENYMFQTGWKGHYDNEHNCFVKKPLRLDGERRKRFLAANGPPEVFKRVIGLLVDKGVIEGVLQPTYNTNRYGQPSPIEQKPREGIVVSSGRVPSATGQLLHPGELSELADGAQTAEADYMARTQEPPTLDESILVSLFAAVGENKVGVYDVRGEESPETLLDLGGYVIDDLCVEEDRLVVLVRGDEGKRLLYFENGQLMEDFDAGSSKFSRSLHVFGNYAFVSLAEEGLYALRSFDLEQKTSNKDHKFKGSETYPTCIKAYQSSKGVKIYLSMQDAFVPCMIDTHGHPAERIQASHNIDYFELLLGHETKTSSDLAGFIYSNIENDLVIGRALLDKEDGVSLKSVNGIFTTYTPNGTFYLATVSETDGGHCVKVDKYNSVRGFLNGESPNQVISQDIDGEVTGLNMNREALVVTTEDKGLYLIDVENKRLAGDFFPPVDLSCSVVRL